MNIGRKYVLPLGLGFAGMLICYIFILIAFGSGVEYPIYMFTYPIVYPVIAIILTLRNSKAWLSSSLLLSALPFLYWFSLLWSEGKMNIQSALKLNQSSGMILIMPITLGIACLASFATSKIKKPTSQNANTGGSS